MTAPVRGPRLHTGLIALKTAQEFIGRYHRHNKPPTGHNTSLGVWIAGTDQLVGVAVIGRPVSRRRMAAPQPVVTAPFIADGGLWEAS